MNHKKSEEKEIEHDIMQEKVERLEKAKENVKWLLDHENGDINFHGLAYWAGVVERLRAEIKNNL